MLQEKIKPRKPQTKPKKRKLKWEPEELKDYRPNPDVEMKEPPFRPMHGGPPAPERFKAALKAKLGDQSKVLTQSPKKI